MTLPWVPVVLVDILGSVMTLLIALWCAGLSWRWARRRRDDNFRHYIFLLTVAIVFFAVSRSFGHLVKQMLLINDLPEMWARIAPFSGAVNSAAFVVIFAFGVYFQRFQAVHLEIERYQTGLEELVEERTEKLAAANLALRQSRARQQALFNALPDFIFRLDRNGTFLEHKAAKGLKTLLPPEQFLGRKVEEVLPPEVAARTRLHLKRVLEARDTIQIFEYQLPAGDGLGDFEARLVNSGGGEVLAVVRDITDRKSAEGKLQAAKEDLERQNIELKKVDRMKDALMMDVSHELKTPVAKHAMQVEILKKSLDKSEYAGLVSDVLEVMEKNIARQKSVITNILVLSRLEAGRRKLSIETVEIETLIEETIAEQVGNIAAAGIELKIDAEPLVIESDRDLLLHVFSNLLSNAIKYRGPEHPWIALHARREGDVVRFSVEDNGLGMTEEECELVFERFYQASASQEGIGLGMPIVRMITDMLGGMASLSSPGKNRGTRATVILPVKFPEIIRAPVPTERPKGVRPDI